eukprot:TRINITY_DN76133_c0_g1_i1.p1 TRINITY_DN76133_c0_g1~~TRINITY_DN76133_c0_g1_i1.p1  ORF type:complete len:461 (+),score=96.22 TRINITY_DN76133_c0_g1_i1:95-1477(+)
MIACHVQARLGMSSMLLYMSLVLLAQGLQYHEGHEALHVTALTHRRKSSGHIQKPTNRKQHQHKEVSIGPDGQSGWELSTPLQDMSSEYTGLIGVGTNDDGQAQFQARVVFDTGSTNLWVASVLCKESPCKPEDQERFYSPAKSSTSEEYAGPNGGNDIDILFGTGELKGPLNVDTYRVGPMVVDRQPFAMIREMTGDVFSTFEFEGILGLAFPSLSFGGITPFFESVIQKKLLKNNEFSFYFNVDSSQPSALLWGGVDKNLYEGDIVMLPVKTPHYWALELLDFRIGKHSLMAKQEKKKTNYLIVDSGTTYFTAPTNMYDKIQSTLKEARCNSVDNYEPLTYVIRSGEDETYELNVTQETYMLRDSADYCSPAFMKLDVDNQYGPAMLLGEVFMRHFFTVFSRGSGDVKEAKVGIARAKIGAVPKGSKTSSGATGATETTEISDDLGTEAAPLMRRGNV